MRYETRPDVLTYKGHEKTIDTLAWWCTACDEAILTGEPLVEQEKAYLELKAEVDEVLSPAQVKAAREKLGLSQRKAGEILGGGPRSFQKYEAGTQAVSTSMSHLLRLLANDVNRLGELTKVEGFTLTRRLDQIESANEFGTPQVKVKSMPPLSTQPLKRSSKPPLKTSTKPRKDTNAKAG
jgi:HTH-type transcriptional regulator/antitoxin MqsA